MFHLLEEAAADFGFAGRERRAGAFGVIGLGELPALLGAEGAVHADLEHAGSEVSAEIGILGQSDGGDHDSAGLDEIHGKAASVLGIVGFAGLNLVLAGIAEGDAVGGVCVGCVHRVPPRNFRLLRDRVQRRRCQGGSRNLR